MKLLLNNLEDLAAWFLARRGRSVLPRFFIGMVISGNAFAQRNYDGYEVRLAHWDAPVWVLNGSQLVDTRDRAA